MAAAEKLSYEARFGNDIRNAAAQMAQKPLKGKHTDWFTDGKGYDDAPAAQPVPLNRYRQITPGMTVKDLASATLNNMHVMGEDSYMEFESRMRRMAPKHRMVRSIKASILNDKPHFGSCRIGKVALARDENSDGAIVTELQYYIANFNTVINTDNPAKIHTPQGDNFGRTFFGVVVDINEKTGKAVGFNKKYGKEGVVFQTGNPKDALMFMTAFSSGQKPTEVREMMEQAVKQASGAAARR
jgi:hypothetical protein